MLHRICGYRPQNYSVKSKGKDFTVTTFDLMPVPIQLCDNFCEEGSLSPSYCMYVGEKSRLGDIKGLILYICVHMHIREKRIWRRDLSKGLIIHWSSTHIVMLTSVVHSPAHPSSLGTLSGTPPLSTLFSKETQNKTLFALGAICVFPQWFTGTERYNKSFGLGKLLP